MTREHKLALIVGFALVLVVGVLVSDHFSSARKSQPRSGIMALGPQEAGADVPQPSIASTAPPVSTFGGARDWPVGMPPTDPVEPVVYGDPTNVMVPSGTDGSSPNYQSGLSGQGTSIAMVPQPGPASGSVTPSGGAPTAPGVSIPNNGALLAPDRLHTAPGTGSISPPPGFTPVHPGEPAGGTVQPIVPEPTVPALPVSTGKVQKRSVKEGETLYGLAEEIYGESALWTKLRDYNKGKIGSNGSVREGVTLTFPPKDVLLGKAVLPGQGGAAAPKSPVAPAMPLRGGPASGSTITGMPTPSPAAGPAAPVSGAKTYTMQKGDVLSLVAKKTLGSAKRWQEIVDANPGVIDDPDSIPAGTVLKIPAR